MKKAFLDSDIILDALLGRPEFSLASTNIFELAHKKQIKILTSPVIFVNVHYFLNKFDRPNKLQLLKSLRTNIAITKVDDKIIDMALNSGMKDFEDAVQYFSAKGAGADYIVTRNTRDYITSNIPVLTAEQFLRIL